MFFCHYTPGGSDCVHPVIKETCIVRGAALTQVPQYIYQTEARLLSFHHFLMEKGEMDVFPSLIDANGHLEPVIRCSLVITSSVLKNNPNKIECMLLMDSNVATKCYTLVQWYLVIIGHKMLPLLFKNNIKKYMNYFTLTVKFYFRFFFQDDSLSLLKH